MNSGVARALRGLALGALTAVASCSHASRPPPLYPPGPLSCQPEPGDVNLPCIACMKRSCCTETKACDQESFPPDSRARSDAARCMCLFLCGVRHRPLADCEQRCGPVSEASRAMSSCVEEHCSDACSKESGGSS
jgi:hypothetical protein